MQNIFCKGALVLVQLEIVLVFGKILDHGDESVSDEIHISSVSSARELAARTA